MKKLQAKDIVFLVGCGISCDRPSCLPLGNALTEFVLKRACGDDKAKAILKTWEKAAKQIKDYNPALSFPLPRLEAICGCIHEIDKIMEREYFLNGFSSFAEIPYNYNHYILAQFLREGATILTTNYDLGIENAYLSEENGGYKYNRISGISSFETKQGGSIYHLHGRANEDILQLGVTVESVKNGFDELKKKHLAGIINAAETVYVLGYGITDSFDITPLMKSENIAGKEIVYIQHKEKGCRKEVEYPSELPNLMKNFKQQDAYPYDTTEYLKKLAGSYAVAIDGKKRHDIEEIPPYDWEKEFRVYKKEYSADEKLLNFLGIGFQIGFNPRIAQGNGISIITEIEDLRNRIHSDNPRLADFFETALKEYDIPTGESVPKMPNEPERMLRKELKEKSHLTALWDECDYFLYKYRDCKAGIEEEDRKRIDFLFSLLCEYSEYDYDRVRYISHISACLKYKALFSARFMGQDPTLANERELMLALDISYFEGVVTALLHSIKSIVIYDRMKGNEGSTQLEMMKDTISSISTTIGCNYYKEIVKKIDV